MPTLVKRLLRVMFCTMFAAAGGCQAVAAVLDKSGDPVETAAYVPEKDNMLILVEDYQNPALVEVTADHMTRLIAEDLIAYKVAPIINPDRLNTYRSDLAPEFRKMQIYAIGAELGAMQVLYANITDFTVEAVPGAEIHKGHAEVRVKIVDTRTKLPRWPRDATGLGHQIIVDVPFLGDSSTNTESAVRRALSRELSARISRLFHDFTRDQEPPPSYPESDLR
jgi:hypothetical protein